MYARPETVFFYYHYGYCSQLLSFSAARSVRGIMSVVDFYAQQRLDSQLLAAVLKRLENPVGDSNVI